MKTRKQRGRWSDKLKRGGVLGTFTKAVDGGCSINFSTSAGRNCDKRCKALNTYCYAERTEKRFDRAELRKKLNRHERLPAARICGAALVELQDLARRGYSVKWLRISSAGSLPQPAIVRTDRLFRTQFRALLDYCKQNGIPVHIPVETYAKARFYRALVGDLAIVRESTHDARRFVHATGQIAGVAGTRQDKMLERIDKARALAKARYVATGRKTISCPAVEASFKSKLGLPYSDRAKCGNCDACARDNTDIVYALHEERAEYSGYGIAQRCLNSAIQELAILAGDIMGPSDVCHLDIVKTCALNLRSVANAIEEHEAFKVYPSPFEATERLASVCPEIGLSVIFAARARQFKARRLVAATA